MLEGADKAKVECAREVLGEVIEHLESQIPKGAVYHGEVGNEYYGDPALDEEARLAEKELTA